MSLALDRAFKETATPGVRETVPTHRSLGVVYDRIKIRRSDLERLITGLPEGLPDLSRLAQLRPGEPVRFRAVDPDEAHDLYVACRAVGGSAELA